MLITQNKDNLLVDLGALMPSIEVEISSIDHWVLEINDHGEPNLHINADGFTHSLALPKLKENELKQFVASIEAIIGKPPVIELSEDQRLIHSAKSAMLSIDLFFLLAVMPN